jgi:hypothetical protein
LSRPEPTPGELARAELVASFRSSLALEAGTLTLLADHARVELDEQQVAGLLEDAFDAVQTAYRRLDYVRQQYGIGSAILLEHGEPEPPE